MAVVKEKTAILAITIITLLVLSETAGAQQYGISSILPDYNPGLLDQGAPYDVSHYGAYSRPDLPPKGFGNSLVPGGYVYVPGLSGRFDTDTYVDYYLDNLFYTEDLFSDEYYIGNPFNRGPTLYNYDPYYSYSNPTYRNPPTGRGFPPSALYYRLYN
jgi:hypothetical protein